MADKKKGIGVTFKVSAKGALSVYGLGRFPVTLYREQWVRLLERTDDLKKFMEEHAGELKAKGDAPAASEEPTARSAADGSSATLPTGEPSPTSETGKPSEPTSTED